MAGSFIVETLLTLIGMLIALKACMLILSGLGVKIPSWIPMAFRSGSSSRKQTLIHGIALAGFLVSMILLINGLGE